MLQSLSMAFDGVMPILILVAIGYILRLCGAVTEDFCIKANSLCFRIFLPCMVFQNLYEIPSFDNVNWPFVLFCVVAVVVLFFIGLLFGRITTADTRQRGVVALCCFRSNSVIIGLVLMMTLFGQAGASAMSIVLSFVIPVFTLLSVIALSVFHEQDKKVSLGQIGLKILQNPLTITLLLALLVLGGRVILVRLGIEFRLSDINILSKTISTLGSLTTPVALIALGGRFKFALTRQMLPQIAVGTVIRLIVSPVLVLVLAMLFSFGKMEFAVLLCLFASPIAVSSVVMAQQMGQDDVLAGQLVVWTTLFSFVTLFIFITVMSYMGII